MSERLPNSSYGELETRSGEHSMESFDRDIDKLRSRIDRLSKATETLDIATQRDVLRFEANEIFLLLQKLFFYLEHDALRGNVGLAASEISVIHEQLKNNRQEQKLVLERMDKACTMLHTASECSRIADQIYELMVTISDLEKKL